MKALLLGFFFSGLFGLFGVNWPAVDEKIADEFPEVSEIDTAQLEEKIATADPAPPLIDVRQAEEFAISHLPGAVNLQQAEDIAARFAEKDQEIIVYCSVGYRSAAVAAQLEELGYSRVRNLRHSIFAWAEESRPLVNGEGSTSFVHPYNRIWGRLLDKSLHRYPE